jgi:hypothetical protein
MHTPAQNAIGLRQTRIGKLFGRKIRLHAVSC